MYLVAIAWLYVTLMMALAEAFSPTGTVLGAVLTFALYGLLPTAIVVYILGTPARKRRLRDARNAAEMAWQAQQQAQAQHPASASATSPQVQQAGHPLGNSGDPDAGRHAPTVAQTNGIAPVREKP